MKKLWTKATKSNQESERERKHRELARIAAEESIVLLENDGALPFAPCKVALYGAGAGMTIKGGTGSGEVNERQSVSIYEGLKNAGFTVTTKEWIDGYEKMCQKGKDAHNIGKVKKALFGNSDDRINIMADSFQYPAGRMITDEDIKKSDTDFCIYVIARQAGECSDRTLSEYGIEDDEIANITKVAGGYKKTVVAINAGCSMDVSKLLEIEGVNAIIYFCQQGMEGGSAFANIVTGKANPSGCLTNTWAKQYTDIPFAMEYSYLNGDTLNEYYKEGIYVGYRYFDSFEKEPVYEFGYGLSYTDFSVECTGVDVSGTSVSVTSLVTNIGKYAGKKVVQLYASCPSGKLIREYQSLAAFGKTKILQPGESETVTLRFDMSGLAGYDEENLCYLLEKGGYVLRIGGSSRQTKICAVLELDENVITRQCRSICPPQKSFDELKGSAHSEKNLPETAYRLNLRAKDYEKITYDYEKPLPADPKAEEVLKKLSPEEIRTLLLGTGYVGVKHIFHAPGAAAYTTSSLADKGICNIVLADGPAGLRIQRRSVAYKSGALKPLEANMEFYEYMPKLFKMFMFGNPKKGDIYYQYCTAFPVGTAMAQTWNTELIEQIGKAIGVEMDEYGVTFLLAPGMNIQRNPLCGRNYEYYSEDPLLTGKIAAAVTKGVQSFDGCYVTIKHFACNNQETNRNRSDSILSERALREIYLKGYQIAVTEGGAKGVMTGYNKLNGVYTPNSYDLCTNALRYEWGFDGVVMTDWFSTGKDLAGNGAAIKAGNDLIMPGGKQFRKMLEQDIRAGVVSEEEIRRCALNVLKAVLNSRIQKEFMI